MARLKNITREFVERREAVVIIHGGAVLEARRGVVQGFKDDREPA